jgi:hypothetical protein
MCPIRSVNWRMGMESYWGRLKGACCSAGKIMIGKLGVGHKEQVMGNILLYTAQ